MTTVTAKNNVNEDAKVATGGFRKGEAMVLGAFTPLWKSKLPLSTGVVRGQMLREIASPKSKDVFDTFSEVVSAKSRFYRLGFTEGEIIAFTSRHEGVYLKALKSMEAVTIKDMVKSARGLNSFTGYRLKRLEQHLAPLGESTIAFLKDTLKQKKD